MTRELRLVELKTLHHASETPKGRQTWEWHLPNGSQVTYYKRAAGEIAGGHYHKGTDPSKNPELFLLLSGKVSIRFVNQDGLEWNEELDASVSPISLIIQPFVLHFFEAVTAIEYIESRLSRFDPDASDVHSAENFYKEVVGKK